MRGSNYIPLLVFISACFSLFSQKVIVVDHHNLPIPYYVIDTDSGKEITNTLGEIQINTNFKDTTYKVINDTLHIKNTPPVLTLGFTKYDESLLIKSVCKNSKAINLNSYGPFRYSAYNKFYISSKQLNSGIGWFNEKVLSKIKYKIEKTSKDRHLVLSESISEREYIDEFHEEEVVKWSQLSGVDQALFLTLNSQLQTTNVYGKHIKIINSKFVNPFHREANIGYHYSISDTIIKDGQELLKVNFYPKRFARFESIKGHAWISKKEKAIIYLYAEPYHTKKMKSSFAIEFARQKKHFIPKLIKTTLFLDNVSSEHITITANQITYISNFTEANDLIKSNFSDLALTYSDQKIDSIKRATPLTKIDSNTYKYFEDGKKIKINRILKWGENLYFGKVYTKYASINLPELITFNRYEKLRLGLSLSSNDKLFKKTTFKGRVAYGFGDKKFKYEIASNTKLLENHKLEIGASYSDDIAETGKADKTITERFHNSEILRQFQLKTFDRQELFNLHVSSKPAKYLTTKVDLNIYKDTPLYSYSYKGEEQFTVRELDFHFRYAFGERYFRFYDERISFKSKFPIVWLHLEKSIANSSINFLRANLRARYTHELIINGTSKFELLSGMYFGDLPYFKLFNGQGSSELKSTIRGAFETMSYNEFTADKYAVLFYSHDFGYFNITQNRTFRPKIEVAFNYGLGKLSKPEDHSGQNLKGFEKGYAETGLAINDLVLFYPAGIKIGLGASFYHRLSYRYPTFGENSILKLTLGFVV